jgi:chaperonin GroEL
VRCIEGLKELKGQSADENVGIQIVRKALEAPLRAIANNAGVEGSVVLQKVIEGKGSFGYNARTDEYTDLKKAGVIDPTKVTRIALENAASIAGMILITDCVISDKPEENQGGGGMPGGMPGGMGGMM